MHLLCYCASLLYVHKTSETTLTATTKRKRKLLRKTRFLVNCCARSRHLQAEASRLVQVGFFFVCMLKLKYMALALGGSECCALCCMPVAQMNDN